MIFSDQICIRTAEKLEQKLQHVGDVLGQEIRSQLAKTAAEENENTAFAAAWLLANCPLSDLANYPVSLFLSCARHGVYLRQHSPFAREIPEDLFLNYVLHIRVNEEELCDCRREFYDALASRVNPLSMHDAVLEANYWCAEQVSYQATDERTISALGAYRSGYGRCGEESTFSVNVLRAVGIPARQIYTPRWAHCDDNHAWVEVYCDGDWYFLGACEPEEVLNRGWFTNASSRAMVIHSRCFGDPSGEEVISRNGMVSLLNNLPLYAVTKKLKVTVKSTDGSPVEGAQVSFGILNYCEFFEAAVVRTDTHGQAFLTCGLGSLNIRARKDGVSCEKLIFVPETDSVELVLERRSESFGQWEDFVFRAPRDQIVSGHRPTEQQKQRCLRKTAEANALRKARVEKLTDCRQILDVVEKYGYSREIYDLLLESRGNSARLLQFLRDESFDPVEKERLLLTLSRKDRRDADPEILQEALILSREFRDLPEELFYPYVVCPRVHFEPLTRNRRFIRNFFTEQQKEKFRQNPEAIWAYIEEQIGYEEALEYSQIVTTPVGALTVRSASPEARRILFVSICRALGIPARMNPVNALAEFYRGGAFVPVESCIPGSCTVVFQKQKGELWQYGTDFGISELRDGKEQQLNLWNAVWNGNELRASLHPGVYRVITDNRLPNGDLHASRYLLKLQEGQTETVTLRKFPADLHEMLDHYQLEEFHVFDQTGRAVSGRELTAEKAVLMWLDEGKEPTEHILNEMLEQAEVFRTLPAELCMMVRSPASLENAKLQQVLSALPRIRVFFDSFVPNVETLARRMYVDPEKLPLILVTTNALDAVYACSGYNVGSADLIVKICTQF